MSDSNTNTNALGCLPLVISLLVLWALLFGVTVDGKHYGIDCSCAEGVKIERPAPTFGAPVSR